VRHRRDARGSSLLLFPAAVLVVIVLGAITVDFTIVFLGERELAGATAAAANDTASRALSNRRFYEHGELVLDAAAARAIATEEVHAALDPARYDNVHVRVDVTDLRLIVTASADVDYLFARGVPGAPRRTRVEATATASLVEE
jgi:Flp pilus assembly protein TadG